MNIFYILLLWHIGELKANKSVEEKLKKKSQFKLQDLTSFPISFWIIALLSFIYGTTWGPFLHISPYFFFFFFFFFFQFQIIIFFFKFQISKSNY